MLNGAAPRTDGARKINYHERKVFHLLQSSVDGGGTVVDVAEHGRTCPRLSSNGEKNVNANV